MPQNFLETGGVKSGYWFSECLANTEKFMVHLNSLKIVIDGSFKLMVVNGYE